MDNDLHLIDDATVDVDGDLETLQGDDLETDAAAILGDTVIELTDEDGNLQEFQVLDVIEHDDATYYVLIDAEDEQDELSEVFVLRLVEDEGDELVSTFDAVEDNEAHTVFELFRERNAEFFDFVDLDGRSD